MRWLIGAVAAAALVSCVAAYTLHSGHYAALGLLPGAVDGEIRRAYRQLALKLHPDKNPSPAAADRWLRVQQAYEALTASSSSHGDGDGGSSAAPPRPGQQQQQQAGAGFWKAFYRQRQQRLPHIASDTEELDTGAFHRRVLASGRGGAGTSATAGAWLIQIYADASPFCRVLSTHWEAAAREAGEALTFARIDAASHPMLVRFVGSHLRLFGTPEPTPSDLPAVFGMPAGCAHIGCAVPYVGRFTAQALQQFGTSQLLQLEPLPPLSAHLLGLWARHAQRECRVAVLAVLPEGQAPPLALLSAAARARGRAQAAYAVWRPADQARWTAAAAGVTSAPALVFWREQGQPPVVVQGAGLSWAVEFDEHGRLPVPTLHAATAPHLPACWLGGGGPGGGGGGTPLPGAVCVVLLGRRGQVPLSSARGLLAALHTQLGGGGGWQRDGADVRAVGSALASGKLQLAWADAARQAPLCRHLLRATRGAASCACLCGRWWRRLPLAALRRCSLRRTAPALIAYRLQGQRQRASRHGGSAAQLLSVAAFPGSPAEPEQLVAWLAAVVDGAPSAGPRERQPWQSAPAFLAGLEQEPGDSAQALLLRVLHWASRADQLWQAAAAAGARALRVVSWRQAATTGLLVAGLLALKQLLDWLSGDVEEELGGCSPAKPSAAGRGSVGSSGASHSSGSVQLLRHSDWQPSPGRFLVVLPLPQEAAAAAAAEQRFAALAAGFRRERRLRFRSAPVSTALTRLLAAAGQQDKQVAPVALVLHPQRGRFQVLQLRDAAVAELRLEAVLDGGGDWLAG